MHSLFESGVSRIQGLEKYITDDVERHGKRLSELEKKSRIETQKRLNEAVSRNLRRFPSDFMFRFTDEETALLKSQIATSKSGRACELSCDCGGSTGSTLISFSA